MNEKLQQAILAARNGQVTDAQLLLTEVLKESPDETQAWFLLSTLVDSEQKKIAYLGKVLALEPDHEMAQKMLARLQAPDLVEAESEEVTEAVLAEEADEVEAAEDLPVPAPVTRSSENTDFLAQEKGDTLPDWLIEEEGLEISEELEPVPVDEADVVSATETDAGLPDWLQEEVAEDWSEPAPPEEETAVATPPATKKAPIEPAPRPKPVAAVKDDQQKQRRFLTGILYALMVVTAVIFVIMVYLAWNTFF